MASLVRPPRTAAPEPAGPKRRTVPHVVYLVGLGVYLGIALWFTKMPGHDIVHQMIWDGPDSPPTVFYLKWWPWAVLHGHNPFAVRQLTWPVTADAAWLTSVGAPALVGAPVTLLLGPVATWNLWLLLAPVTASMAMLVLLDALEVPALSALAGGFIFGFSSFVVAGMEHHLFLTLVFPLPLLAALLVRRLRGQIRPAWFVGLSILLAGFLLYTSTELFATATLAGLLGLFLLLIWYRRDFLATARRLAKEVTGILVGIAALGAPLVGYAVADSGIFSSTFQSSSVFSIDLLNYVTPTPTTLLGGRLASRLVPFTGNRPEQIGYFGIVLVALSVVAVVQGCRSRRWVTPFAIWTVMLALFALGPHLHLDGDTSRSLGTHPSSVPLPWAWAARLPVVKDALPSRLILFVFLAVATATARWTSWAPSRRQRRRRGLALVAGAVLLWPNPAGISWARAPVPQAGTAQKLATWVPRSTGLLVLADWPRRGALWSEATGFRVAVTGRPWGYDPYRPDYDAWPLSKFANRRVPPPGAARQLEGFCATHDDGAVAVPDDARAWRKVVGALGWPSRVLPGATVYRVPKDILTAYRHTTPAQLHVAFYRTEVKALEAAAACYLRRGGTIPSLRPATAAGRGCLSRAYLGTSASTDWTTYNGWLGPQDGQIGVGVLASGQMAAKVFAHSPLPQKWLVYHPTATIVTFSRMADGPMGTYMAVGPFTTPPARR